MTTEHLTCAAKSGRGSPASSIARKRAASGALQLVGEAGIGKSFLLGAVGLTTTAVARGDGGDPAAHLRPLHEQQSAGFAARASSCGRRTIEASSCWWVVRLSWAWQPVKTLTMNALTLAAAFGVLVVIFQDGRLEALLDYTGSGALEAATMTIVAAIAFALATDYGVFLLTRIKEFRDHGLTQPEGDRADECPLCASRCATTARIPTRSPSRRTTRWPPPGVLFVAACFGVDVGHRHGRRPGNHVP